MPALLTLTVPGKQTSPLILEKCSFSRADARVCAQTKYKNECAPGRALSTRVIKLKKVCPILFVLDLVDSKAGHDVGYAHPRSNFLG